jgi:hypothetical protein
MPEYRILFLDHMDYICGAEGLNCTSATEAINAARHLLATQPVTEYPVLEVWQADGRVCRITSASLMDSPPATHEPVILTR